MYFPISTLLKSKNLCCLLTLDWVVNQSFSAQDAPVKISGSSQMAELNVWML